MTGQSGGDTQKRGAGRKSGSYLVCRSSLFTVLQLHNSHHTAFSPHRTIAATALQPSLKYWAFVHGLDTPRANKGCRAAIEVTGFEYLRPIDHSSSYTHSSLASLRLHGFTSLHLRLVAQDVLVESDPLSLPIASRVQYHLGAL